MLLNELEKKKLTQIQEWEEDYINKKENGYFNQVVKVIKKPMTMLTKCVGDSDIIIIDKVIEAIEEAIKGFMDAGQDIIKATYNKNKAVEEFKDIGINSLDDLYKVEVDKLENLARNIIIENKVAGGIEGFALGLGDITMAIADIPLIFLVCFRVMQQIASIYGYDPEENKEKLFMLKAMSFGTVSDQSAKLAVQAELQALKIGIKRYTFKQMQQMGGKYGVIITSRQIAKNLGKKLTKNTLLKGIPVLGAGIGAFFNYSFITDTALICNNLYEKRFLEDKMEKQVIVDAELL